MEVIPLSINTDQPIIEPVLVTSLQPADQDGFISCTGTKADFSVFMTQIWMILNAYATEVPHDEHSILWH